MKLHDLGIGLGLLAMGVACQAQGMQEIRLYAGEPVTQSGVKLLPWGSGTAQETEEHVFMGSKSLKITTHGDYQGARLVFQNPLSLKSVLDDNTAYLQFLLVLPGKDTTGRMGGDYGSMMRGMMGRGGGRSGMGYPGGPGGMGGPGGPPGGMYGGMMGRGGRGGNADMTKPKPVSRLRVVLGTTDGKRAETYLDLDTAVRSNTNPDWSTLAVPVAALKGLKDTSGDIQEIDIFGDSPSTLYLGEARIVHDQTPIRIEDLGDQQGVPVNSELTLTGAADAGLSPVKYEWTFDTEHNPGVDAEGKTVKHTYRKALRDPQGNTVPYIVTLTVRDPYGIKQPASRTFKVYVTL